jgi:adenylyltransferase/sulfurtransferase
VCGAHPTITTLRESAASCDARVSSGPETSVRELKARIDAGRRSVILDVREPSEAAICSIPGSRLIPMGELPRRLGELEMSFENRRALQGRWTQRGPWRCFGKKGSRRVQLTGGILQWINEIDALAAIRPRRHPLGADTPGANIGLFWSEIPTGT